VSGVSVGKTVRFTIAAADADEATSLAEDLCASFLTNPVIEDASVSVSPACDSA
jgi:phosphoribosylformylglycinamidine (FGAM) synthase PurS component